MKLLENCITCYIIKIKVYFSNLDLSKHKCLKDILIKSHVNSLLVLKNYFEKFITII